MSDFKIDTLEVESQIIAPAATTSVAGLQSPSDKTKLDSVQSGATANSTDAQLRDRATHTGTQLAATISDFAAAASAASPVQSVAGKVGIVSLVKGDVGLGNVDNTSDLLKPVSNATQSALNLKYDASNPNGYETPAQLNTRDTNNRNRTNHTGTQLSSTISDFTEAAQDSAASMLTSATHDGVSVNYNDVGNSLAITNTDKGSVARTAHEAAVDPHPQYETSTEAQAKADAAQAFAIQRGNHTGTQTSSTISDFAATVRSTVLTGYAVGANAVLAATDTILAAFGKVQGQINAIITTLAGKANLAGGNVFTGNQTMGAALVNIVQAPLNLVNSAAGVLRTQLNLVNGGGGGGAGSAIDFHTYDDQPTSTQPGARIGAVDDNFSAYFTFLTKIPGAPANLMAERMRITNDGRVGIGGVPVSSAKFQIDSTTEGFLLPRMTSAQRLAIAAPVAGLIVYDTDLSCRCVYAGTHWTFEYDTATTAIQTSTSTTYANITELVTPSLEAGLYAFRFRGIMQSTATATGVGLRLANGTGTISELSINWTFSQAGNGTDKNFEYSQNALGDNVTSASTLTANANFPVAGDGVVRVSANGTLAIQLRSETAGVGISIRPNSSLIFRKVAN